MDEAEKLRTLIRFWVAEHRTEFAGRVAAEAEVKRLKEMLVEAMDRIHRLSVLLTRKVEGL